MTKLSTESYKGVRDFYPEDMFVQNHIFSTWRKVVERFGYQEYSASVLEPSDLYKAKSGEEIVNEQTYTFKDRGDRDVTLRPEMTPTVARMVAAKRRDLGFPLRWYSIPNLFRYEQPQRGRLREHWQLNVDIFGVSGIEADAEVITIAHEIMLAFGATKKDFEIGVNSRKFFNLVYKTLGFSEEESHKTSKLTDKMEKMDAGEFQKLLQEIAGKEKADAYHKIITTSAKDMKAAYPDLHASLEYQELNTLYEMLLEKGIEIKFKPWIVRGFDYYTGIVFEVNDTDPKNKRALFGGGRYEDLLSLFGGEKITATGFGMGDVTVRDFLETRGLMPAYTPTAQLSILPLSAEYFAPAEKLATVLRSKGLAVAIDFSERKVADQIKTAVKQSIPFITIIGEDEVKTNEYKVKELKTSIETTADADEIATLVTSSASKKTK